MINTEEFLMREKEVLDYWKGLLLRQSSEHTHYMLSLCVCRLDKERLVHKKSLSSCYLDFISTVYTSKLHD